LFSSVIGLFSGSIVFALIFFIDAFRRIDTLKEIAYFIATPFYLTGIAVIYAFPILVFIHAFYSMWVIRYLIQNNKSIIWWFMMGLPIIPLTLFPYLNDNILGLFITPYYLTVAPIVAIPFLRWILMRNIQQKQRIKDGLFTRIFYKNNKKS
jgi:hypothetical protein